MPTLLTRYVNTASAGGGNGSTNGTGSGGTNAFAGLEEANVWLETNHPSFITSDIICDILCSAPTGVADTTLVHLDSLTTSATQYLKIRANGTGQRAVSTGWMTDRYRLETSAVPFALKNTSVNHLIVSGLQMKCTDNIYGFGGAIYDIAGYNGTQFNRFLGMRVQFLSSVGGAVVNFQSGYRKTVQNCIIEGAAAPVWSAVFCDGADLGVIIDNNTIVGGTVGFRCDSGYFVSRNNIFVGVTTEMTGSFYTTPPLATDYNFSDGDGPLTGAHSATGRTFVFVTGHQLSPSDTGARNAGENLSADAEWGVAAVEGSDVDIDLVARVAPWDAGASEAAGAGVSAFAASVIEC